MAAILILEGADLTGKTMLAKYLAATLGTPYIHTGAPGPDGEWAETVRILSEYEFRNDLVFDRLVISDFTYRNIWPRAKPNSFFDLMMFLTYMRQTDSAFIQSDIPEETLIDRYKVHGDDAPQLNIETLIQTQRRYRRFFDAIRDAKLARVIKYDSSRYTPQRFFSANQDELLAAVQKPAIHPGTNNIKTGHAVGTGTEATLIGALIDMGISGDALLAPTN